MDRQVAMESYNYEWNYGCEWGDWIAWIGRGVACPEARQAAGTAESYPDSLNV